MYKQSFFVKNIYFKVYIHNLVNQSNYCQKKTDMIFYNIPNYIKIKM